MAQWSRADKTLYAKLVYYGPAYGGKTTNLESLHRITDPEGAQKLLSLKTSDDRTLFFDLLPFDLGNILGYQVAMKLYTVPGQVKYNATRRVVLAGVDAVVFVADSTPGCGEKNRESLENLDANLRANRLNPDNIPVIFQCNKQDLPDALPPEEVAYALGIPDERIVPASALEGRGVMETFMTSSKAMLRSLASFADERTRSEFDVEQLSEQIERAFEPFLARVEAAEDMPTIPHLGIAAGRTEAIVAAGDDLVEQSVSTSLRLGEELSGEKSRSVRLEKEARALRRMSEILRQTGASFDSGRILERTLSGISEVVAAAVVSLLRLDAEGRIHVERVRGRESDPLHESEDGRALLARLIPARGPCVMDDIQGEVHAGDARSPLEGLRAAASVPVDTAVRRALVVYAPMPDGRFTEQDVRFLATTAAHLAVGLEKSRLHRELARHRDLLEKRVGERTDELAKAYRELQEMGGVKDRFLTSISHEMRTPLTAVVNAATFLRDYEGEPAARSEMARSILASCETLETHLSDLFRMVRSRREREELVLSDASPTDLVAEAMHLAGSVDPAIDVDPDLACLTVDLPKMARALAHLLDNACKFSPPDGPVELQIAAAMLERDGVPVRAMRCSVMDRGAGVPERDRDRIFAPFEQGGDPVTEKPPGIGLGLHEARNIAQQHGGTLECLPRDGGGTEFRMTVPLHSPVSQMPREAAGA